VKDVEGDSGVAAIKRRGSKQREKGENVRGGKRKKKKGEKRNG